MQTSHPAALTFRRARAADAGVVLDLVESAYRGERSRAGWTTEADLLAGQRTDPEGVAVALAGGWVLLAVDAVGTTVGCCQLERRGDAAYFGMFAVSPTRQGQGLGDALLAEAERRVGAEWGACRMRMLVIDARVELITWYERRGYLRTGETEPFPYGDERFGRPLRPDLAFAVLVKDFGEDG